MPDHPEQRWCMHGNAEPQFWLPGLRAVRHNSERVIMAAQANGAVWHAFKVGFIRRRRFCLCRLGGYSGYSALPVYVVPVEPWPPVPVPGSESGSSDTTDQDCLMCSRAAACACVRWPLFSRNVTQVDFSHMDLQAESLQAGTRGRGRPFQGHGQEQTISKKSTVYKKQMLSWRLRGELEFFHVSWFL